MKKLNYEIKENSTTMCDTLNIELPDNIGKVIFFKWGKYVAFDPQELNK